jgi:ligand-binding sensor domain-containing protein/signal transduction histidine kinase
MKCWKPLRFAPRPQPVVLWVLAAVGLILGNARSADLNMRGYYLERFRAERGLPQNTVTALLQTRDGYLWIVTPFGLARFDGVSFKPFTAGNTPGLREDMFTSLAEDNDGVLWAGTRDGLLRYEAGTFERLDLTHGLQDCRVDAVCARRSGGVWVGTHKGIAQVHGRQGTPVTSHGGVDAVFEDSRGNVWFGVNRVVYRLVPSSGAVEMIYEKTMVGRSTSFWEEPGGAVWFGSRDGLHRWYQGRLERKDGRRVECVMGDPVSGELWVGFGGGAGLHLLKEDQWHAAAHPNWAELRSVRSCLTDKEGNVWLGTESDGLLRLRAPRLESFGKENGLLDDCLWTLSSSVDGGVWVGGEQGYGKIHNNRVSPFLLPEQPSPQIVRSILQDRSGRLWVGDHAHGVYRFDQSGHRRFTMRGFTKSLYEDRSGAIWVGTGSGMARIRDDTVTFFTTAEGLSDDNVRAFHEDRHGTLWIGTSGGGVNLFSNGTFRVLDGLSSHKAWSFHEDRDGVIWIGTNRGLNRYENGRIFVFTRKQGLFDDLVNHVVEDDSGVFWISCNRGIYRVSRKELNEVAAGRSRAVTYVSYGEADGMVSSETNGEYQPAGCKSSDGRIWFPTQRGAVVIDPKTVYRNELPPPVIVEQVLANGRVVFGGDPEVTPPSGNSGNRHAGSFRLAPGGAHVLEIRYTATSFVEPSKVCFKVQLEGYEEEWRDAGPRRVAYFTNLRPGRYTFRVTACNNHGYWNERGAEVPFIVEPHFHETWSFYALCALGVVTGAAGVQAYRLRVQRHMLRLEQQALLQRERARIAQDMHDDLGANLTRIAILSEVAKHQAQDPEHVRSTADSISGMARRVIDNISEIVWVTNPKNDHLDNLAGYLRGYAAEFFENTPAECQFHFPDELPQITVKGELRRDVLLVFKEVLNNVARHSGATEVRITLSVAGKDGQTYSLRVAVADNGCGFDPAGGVSGGNGLRNMASRIEQREGHLAVVSSPEKGTEVSFCVDLSVKPKGERSTTFM